MKVFTTKIFIVIVFLIGLISFFKKSKSYNILRLKMASQFSSQYIGFSHRKSDEYIIFNRLKHSLTIDEFENLFDENEGVIKAYAFWGLIEKCNSNYFNLLLDNLTNSEKIRVRHFDSDSYWSTSDLLISIAYSKLSSEDIHVLNSVILEKQLDALSYYEYLNNEHGWIVWQLNHCFPK